MICEPITTRGLGLAEIRSPAENRRTDHEDQSQEGSARKYGEEVHWSIKFQRQSIRRQIFRELRVNREIRSRDEQKLEVRVFKVSPRRSGRKKIFGNIRSSQSRKLLLQITLRQRIRKNRQNLPRTEGIPPGSEGEEAFHDLGISLLSSFSPSA